MTDIPMISLLAQQRKAAKLTQTELAERVGVSRQTLSAVEAGRQTPSTSLSLQLARVLGCGVEDLFRLAHARDLSALLAPPARVDDGQHRPLAGSRVIVGRVDGRWAAHRLGDDSTTSADGIVVGEPDGRSRATVEALVTPEEMERAALVAGCAPLLGVLAARLGRRFRDARAHWIAANSHRALDLLEANLVHMAGVHLAGDAHGTADRAGDHAELVRRRFPGRRMLVINLTQWRQGLVVARGNPLAVRAPVDLLRADVRIARREEGAGAYKLLADVFAAEGGDTARLARGPVADGHDAVARLVRWGVADAGVAIESAALAQGLDFIPLSHERFDLVVPLERAERGPVARLLDLLEEREFRAEAARLPGYDLSLAGHATTVIERSSDRVIE